MLIQYIYDDFIMNEQTHYHRYMHIDLPLLHYIHRTTYLSTYVIPNLLCWSSVDC